MKILSQYVSIFHYIFVYMEYNLDNYNAIVTMSFPPSTMACTSLLYLQSLAHLEFPSTHFTRRKDYRSYTEFTQTEIALLVGFENASSFSKAFRQFTGIAPGAYRKL